MTLSTWQFATRQLLAGRPVFLAFVAANTRHSPGTAGAFLAVAPDGAAEGTIGGGIMEAEVLKTAAEAFRTGAFSPTFQHLIHRRKAGDHPAARPSGLICAGQQTNVYYLAVPDKDLELLQEISRRLKEDLGGRLQLSPEGISLDDYVPRRIEAPLLLQENEEDFSWRFSLQLLNWKRIAVIGGGHCGLALSQTMHILGYTVTIFDTRKELFTMERNTFAARKHIIPDFADAGDLITHPAFTHVAVMTANLPSDVRGLFGVAEKPFPYIGVMGAPAKLTRIKAELLDLGVSPDALQRLRAPIGLPMTSNTPEEIAVSIAAELLQLREKLFPFTAPD